MNTWAWKTIPTSGKAFAVIDIMHAEVEQYGVVAGWLHGSGFEKNGEAIQSITRIHRSRPAGEGSMLHLTFFTQEEFDGFQVSREM